MATIFTKKREAALMTETMLYGYYSRLTIFALSFFALAHPLMC